MSKSKQLFLILYLFNIVTLTAQIHLNSIYQIEENSVILEGDTFYIFKRGYPYNMYDLSQITYNFSGDNYYAGTSINGQIFSGTWNIESNEMSIDGNSGILTSMETNEFTITTPFNAIDTVSNIRNGISLMKFKSPLKSLALDGADDYLSHSEQIVDKEDFTIEAWVRLDSASTKADWIFEQIGVNNSGNLDHLKWLWWNGNNAFGLGTNKISFGYRAVNNAIVEHFFPVELQDCQWYHLAAVQDYNSLDNSSSLSLYINGNLVSTKIINQVSPPVLASTPTNYIGWRAFGGPFNHYLAGAVDDVRLWSEARTAQEIMAHINAPPLASSANLLLYFNFETINSEPIPSFINLAGSGIGYPNNFLLFDGLIPQKAPCDEECPNELIHLNELVEAGSYKAQAIISKGIVPSYLTVEYKASNSISLQPGFFAQSGSNFLATIEECQTISSIDYPLTSKIRQHSTFPDFEQKENIMTVSPNPSSGSITIKYNLNEPSTVNINIYTITGELIHTFKKNQKEDRGNHIVTLNLVNHTEGIYLVELKCSKFSQTEKIILAK